MFSLRFYFRKEMVSEASNPMQKNVAFIKLSIMSQEVGNPVNHFGFRKLTKRF